MDSGASAKNINIRYGQHLNKDRLVLDFENRVTASVFTLGNPNRLVIDIPKDAWDVKTSNMKKSRTIKGIRIGEFESQYSRLVVDLTHAVSIETSFWLPAVHGLKNRLVIDFKRGTSLKPQTLSQASFVIRPLKKPIPEKNPTYTAPRSFKKQLIVIDPGHGGKDSGAISKNGLYEKDIVLKLAKELAQALKKTGRYNVRLTRSQDHYIALRKRVAFAQKNKADLFISLHADSIENRHVSGASVYTLSEKASDAQTAKLASRENKSDLIAGLDLSEEDPDVTNILLDLVTRDTTNQSKFFANLIVEELQNHRVKTLERPHRHAGFAVLKAPDVPAILVESGFMSNKKEARQLNDPQYRKNIVRSLVTGVDSYFVRVASLHSP